jgi:moderate conductance mechanosensitive channel
MADGTKLTMLSGIHTWAVNSPLSIILTIVGTVLLALIVRWLARRIIVRAVRTFSDNTFSRRLARARATHAARSSGADEESPEILAERIAARARTVGALLGSIATFVIFAVAVVVVLDVVGLDITPVIASAGVVGIAVGFGAQSLIRDFLTGVFMILEDQYGVGDVIDAGQATGTVEDVGLRVTKLRDDNGVLWYVPNGAIMRVGNKSQGWAVANVEVPVAYSEDLERVTELLRNTAEALAADPDWHADILAEPATSSVESMSTDNVVLRVQLRTQPLRQNDVARELRVRVKDALEEAGVAYKQAPP